jgi:opacity protein-like surface antigen
LTVVVLWVVAGLALLVALMAAAAARRAARKLEALNQSYWELRYDFTRLRSQVARLDPGEPDDEAASPQPAAQVTFVPLSSMKKKNG